MRQEVGGRRQRFLPQTYSEALLQPKTAESELPKAKHSPNLGPNAFYRLEAKMTEYVFPFEKLDVWQMAVDLAEYVLDLLEAFPSNKHFRLVGQMEGAVTSPSQNTLPC